MRQAFQNVWDLNVKAMPISVIWSISFWFMIESPDLPVKFFALFTANVAALASASAIVKLERPSQKMDLLSALRSSFMWKTVHPIGILLIMALHNISGHEKSSLLAKYLFLSVAISSLILWVLATVALVPIQARESLRAQEFTVLEAVVLLIGVRKRYFLFALLIILMTWPLVFFYVFIALTLSQSIIMGQLPVLNLNHYANSGTKVKNV